MADDDHEMRDLTRALFASERTDQGEQDQGEQDQGEQDQGEQDPLGGNVVPREGALVALPNDDAGDFINRLFGYNH